MADSVPGIFAYFVQSNLPGQIIVIALFFFSLIAWTLMIRKHLELNRFHKLNKNIEIKLEGSPVVTALNLNKESGIRGPFASLIR